MGQKVNPPSQYQVSHSRLATADKPAERYLLRIARYRKAIEIERTDI